MCRLNIVAGRRQIALDAYLRPAMPRGNLRVVAGALAHRLLMDRQRCVGVEYSVSGGLYRAAAGEIVLSAGVIGTPKLLMLSGIGPASALAPHGIEVVAELPGVGENLHDHPAAHVTYRPARPVPAAANNHGEALGLWVHGVGGLRIADGSIMLSIVSGNTNATVYAIAERAAALVGQ